MIPKVVHYIWLGNRKLNNTSLMCINSWRRNLPGYEIKLWNEESLNLSQLTQNNKFLMKCMQNGLWAFASDYLRLYILYKEGGVYLDTDVEVIKSFEDLHERKFFIGLEADDYIGTGVIGAEPGNPCIKKILDFYDEEIWNVDYYNNPIIFKNVFEKNKELFKDCTVLPIDFFSPYLPGIDYTDVIETSNTICIHWYNANWGMTRKGYVFLQTKHIKNPVVLFYQILRKNIGYYRKRKLLNC